MRRRCSYTRFGAGILSLFMTCALLSACGTYRRPSEPNETKNQIKYDYNKNYYVDRTKQVRDDANNNTSIAQVVGDVVPSVVGISTIETKQDSMFDANKVVQGVGSGVIVHSDGYILTNDHVAGGNPTSLTVILKNGDELEGKTMWSDPTLDLAVVKVNAKNLPVARIGDSEELIVGETAIAIGTPLGLQFQHTVTSGIISALGRTIQVPTERGENFMEDLIQTDASINPGNSGGPLINSKGEVVGINTVKVTSAEGIGFAIPIDVAKPIISHFIEEGEFITPYIGVVGFDREIASYYKQDKNINDGVYVVNIDPRGPAYKAGVRIDDIITHIGGKKIDNMLQLRKTIYAYKVGSKVKVRIIRNGQQRDVVISLDYKPV
ncbi:MAG: trypsin-like peptidase domain-containing protein [Xylanivirga thermophila]|jgi:serine protease Do|uniref:S1C family serine protease n=1 Tax=Xylanivirga thermophila TaxID=2496273 RepID=UPI00101CE26B|nr:trypsin-like peptidase domain-containing protein [Xylanivirga thermophila]